MRAAVSNPSCADDALGLGTETAACSLCRPDWAAVLKDTARAVPDPASKRIGLFFCGPHPVATQLGNMCVRGAKFGGVDYSFRPEHF